MKLHNLTIGLLISLVCLPNDIIGKDGAKSDSIKEDDNYSRKLDQCYNALGKVRSNDLSLPEQLEKIFKLMDAELKLIDDEHKDIRAELIFIKAENQAIEVEDQAILDENRAIEIELENINPLQPADSARIHLTDIKERHNRLFERSNRQRERIKHVQECNEFVEWRNNTSLERAKRGIECSACLASLPELLPASKK